MYIRLALSIILSVVFTTHLSALEAPAPQKGYPSILSKKFTTNVDDLLVTIACPQGWGIGEMLKTNYGTSSISLYPSDQGYGLQIEIVYYDSEVTADNQLNYFKSTFKTTTQTQNGFESELKKAYYSCTRYNQHLVTLWYSLPKKTKESDSVWNSLKNAISFEQMQKTEANSSGETPPVEKTFSGWACHHPENKCTVFFEPFGVSKNSINTNPDFHYLIEFETFKAKGYFFIKWDQFDASSEETYQSHINEMIADIVRMDPTQTNSGQPTINLSSEYGYHKGSPYSVFTFMGDNFLFGFVIKQNNPYITVDVNDFIKKVSWTIE